MNTPKEFPIPEPVDFKLSDATAPSPPPDTEFNPDNPPWGLLQAILVCFTSVALLLIIPGFFALIYIATKYRGMPLSQEILLNDKNYILIMVVSILPSHLLTILLAWAVASRFGKVSSIKTLGLSWPRHFGLWKTIGLSVLLFLVAMAMLYLFGGADTQLEKILRSSRAAALTMAFLATVTAPAMEEVVYRGLLYPALQRLAGPIAAILLVTSIFGGLHIWQYWPNFGAISAIMLLSLVLTVVRARTQRLLPCYMIHLIFNGIQAVIIVADPYLRPLIETPQQEAAPAILQLALRFL